MDELMIRYDNGKLIYPFIMTDINVAYIVLSWSTFGLWLLLSMGWDLREDYEVDIEDFYRNKLPDVNPYDEKENFEELYMCGYITKEGERWIFRMTPKYF